MRVLFVGDSPTVSTGFARCTRVACAALQSRGHEVFVLGMAYYGDPHKYPYEVWPCYAPLDGNARSYGGESRLPSMVARVKPDVVVILQDPWNLPAYFEYLNAAKEQCAKNGIDFNIPPIVGWLAVDSKNQKAEQLRGLSHVMVWTEFAKSEFIEAIKSRKDDLYSLTQKHSADEIDVRAIVKEIKSLNELDFDIVPLGVDTSLFYPRDKNESRLELGFNQLGIPLDSFIVGVVGRNQKRKRLELTLDYFSAWVHQYNVSDAYLYLHVAPTGENSCDLKSLVRYFDLRGRVIVHEPRAGVGDSESRMPFVYSAMDVYMTQTQGEGFCLPALEAMACGVECILPNHSAFGENGGWVEQNCAYRVACNGVALTAPQGNHPYTVGSIADKEETVKCLEFLYQQRGKLGVTRDDAMSLAKKLSWQNTGTLFVDLIERFMTNREAQS